MNNELYFIPILIKAFRHRDLREALPRALERIRELGRDPAHSVGYEQFLEFMRLVEGRTETSGTTRLSLTEAAAQRIAIELASGEFEDDERLKKAARDFIFAFPSARILYRRVLHELERDDAIPGDVMIRIEKDGLPLGEAVLSSGRSKIAIPRLSTGAYVLKLATGRVLWEGSLEAKHLAWPQAHPGEPLELAAATEEDVARSTLEASLLGGEMSIRVFAGMRYGRMEILRNG